jgi:hypothetical protein
MITTKKSPKAPQFDYTVMFIAVAKGILCTMAVVLSAMVRGEEAAASAKSSPAEIIREAADVSQALAAVAEAPPEKDLGFMVEPIEYEDRQTTAPRRFARESQIEHYMRVRSWSLAYAPMHCQEWTKPLPARWPGPIDAPSLRELLKDKDPARRGLAAEALATLYRPEDLPLLAGRLGDTAEAAPVLGYNMRTISLLFSSLSLGTDRQPDRLNSLRSWHRRTVADYARQGIALITRKTFADEAEFAAWWKINSDARHCLWYWQRRIQREQDEAELAAFAGYHRGLKDRPDDYAAREKQLETARGEIRKTIPDELRQLPPEVEAKIRLLTTDERAGCPVWPDPPSLRVTQERLLELLDRKDLWADVPWDAEHYNLLAERLGLWADVLFAPKHIPRLRSALERERNGLWWSGKTALIIGISRLLPAARIDNLDNPESRDGILRDTIRHEQEVFVRGYCATELVRTGLPANREFLKQLAFEPYTDDGSLPTMRQAILQALGRPPPLSKEKRELLIDIVLDERFRNSWTWQNDGMDCQYAIRAINAHAGRELITDELKYALNDPKRSADALKTVRECIEQLHNDNPR